MSSSCAGLTISLIIPVQGARMEEIRDTHRLEGSSQSDQITKLRTQLSTAESNLASKAAELLSLQTIRSDLTKAQTSAKEEEEKRTKAISLLKTVRMKLVKVEKEKEEIERDRAEERAERSTARDELEKYRADREREVTALRRGFEKELSGQKERHEKDLAAKKAAWELEMITTKVSAKLITLEPPTDSVERPHTPKSCLESQPRSMASRQSSRSSM